MGRGLLERMGGSAPLTLSSPPFAVPTHLRCQILVNNQSTAEQPVTSDQRCTPFAAGD